MFCLAQLVRYRYTAMESCIPAVRGPELVQKCLQLMGICKAAIGKDSSLQLSPF